MKHLVLGALAALALACQPAHAQLEVGQRVRIFAPTAGFQSTRGVIVLELTADSLRVEIQGMQQTIARNSINRLDVSDGRRSRVPAAAIGSLGGMALGAVVGWQYNKAGATRTNPDGTTENARESRLPHFTVAGGIVGAIFGALRPSDRWRAVPMGVAADVTPTATGAALTFTRRF